MPGDENRKFSPSIKTATALLSDDSDKTKYSITSGASEFNVSQASDKAGGDNKRGVIKPCYQSKKGSGW